MHAEDLNHTLYNLYYLRGTQVRNGQKWSTNTDKVMEKDLQVSFGSHHWPTWGNGEVFEFMEGQRDL